MARHPGSGAHARGRGAGPKKTPALYDPSQSLTGRSLRNAARALTNLQTRPAINQLARQLAENRRQAAAATRLVGSYYDQYADHARQAVTDAQGIADRTNATLARIGQDTQEQIGAAGTVQQQQLQGLADTGLDGGAYAQLARAIAEQQGTAATNAGTYKGFGALQGGNWQGLTATQQSTGALRGQEQLGLLGNAYAQANVEPAAKLAELRASRGDLMAKNVGALRESERSYKTAVATLGLNQQKAADDAAYRAGMLGLRAGDQRLRASAQQIAQQAHADSQALSQAQFVAKYGLTPGDLARIPNPGAWLKANAPVYRTRTNAPQLSPNQVNNYFAQIEAAKSAISRVRELLPHATTKQIRGYLSQGYVLKDTGTDQHPRTTRFNLPRVQTGGYGFATNSAMDLLYNDGLSRENVRRLHALGLRDLRSRYPIAY